MLVQHRSLCAAYLAERAIEVCGNRAVVRKVDFSTFGEKRAMNFFKSHPVLERKIQTTP